MKAKLGPALILDCLAGALLLAWIYFNVAPGPMASPATPPEGMLRGYLLPQSFRSAAGDSPLGLPLFLAYLVPLVGLYRFASLFFLRKLGSLADPAGLLMCLLRILATAVAVFSYVAPMLEFADSAAWFSAIPVESYIGLGVMIAIHLVSIAVFARYVNNRNPVYREYRAFKEQQGGNALALNKKASRAANAVEVLFRIRTKLFFAFIGVISLILVVLSMILLNSYRVTIIKAVGDAARGQVEQASANYRVNLGDAIAMSEYLARQKELNDRADFTYESLTIYSGLRKEVYLDELSQLDGQVPDFRAEYDTRFPGLQYPSVEALPSATVREWGALTAKNRGTITIGNGEEQTLSFISPIIKQDMVRKGDERVRRERLLGFSAITFREVIILRPYFRTRITVYVCTLLFLYIAVILTYLVGNYIVNPLLFLRMNVRKISDVLLTMIRGQSRISSQSLVYNDCVTSRDEIKSLSSEINDMVTVIRGIVPYISASTLKQAESGTASTRRKELTFLFTDIRGFTTLCEGMEPEEVVGVLNRYLDLETEIILNNHGDVDKFVGDEMMAFFEGPKKEVNACRAAMQIRHAMMEEKERREAEGLPIVSIGIGINTGPVVFGSVGARDRMDYTSIGDTVNLAARLEGANKAYGSKSIITEAVYDRVQENFLCRELDFIAVKGKTEPVRIYEILQEIPKAQPKLVEIKTLFEKGLAAYRGKRWDRAQLAFKKNVDLYEDVPSAVFLDRIKHFSKVPPPPKWDGVFRMTVK